MSLFSADHRHKLSPNCAAAGSVTVTVTVDSKSLNDGGGGTISATTARSTEDPESNASELPCGSAAAQTLVRGKQAAAGSGRTTVDVAVLKREDKSLQTTIMLITVSTSYVLAYLPVLVNWVVYFILMKFDRDDVEDKTSMVIAGNYTKILYVAGVAVNFFLYTVSGRVFRKQLIQMLSSVACRRNKHSSVSGARRRAAAAEL